MIVVENEYMEQLEVNTWKRLSCKPIFGKNKSLAHLLPIGVEKKLFIYNKNEHKFYYMLENKKNV